MRRTLLEVRFGETAKPALETSALPGARTGIPQTA